MRGRTLQGWLFVAPTLATLGVFFVLPLIGCAWLSLYRWDLLAVPTWVGLDNYRGLVTGAELGPVLGRTLAYAAGTVAGSLAIGLALALALHRVGRLGRLARAAIFSSYVVSWVGVSLLWSYVLDGDLGPLSALVRAVGLSPPDWLADPDWALASLVGVSIWKIVGYDMVLYLAALEDIPKDLHEAARLDGAAGAAAFWTITWPLLRPTTAFLAVTGTLMSFQAFDLVRVMTGGGPAGATQIYVYWLFEQAFSYFRLGPAAAAVMLLLPVLALLTWLAGRWGRG